MAPGTLHVEFVGSTYSTFEPYVEIFSEIAFVLTLKNVQVLDTKLFIFVPPQSQPSSSSLCPSHWIQQIEDTFVINLQKRYVN